MATGDFLAYIDPATQRALGHYSATLITGATTGMAANAPIASFRWTDTGQSSTSPNLAIPRVAVILNIDAGAVITTAFTAGQSVDIEAIVARAFTASDSGGTQITAPSRARANMQPSLVGDLRVATTGGLTAGTRTLDGSGFACATIYTQNAAGCGDMQQSIYAVEATGVHPIVLTTNEGIILRVPTAQGAAGVVKYYLTITWAEVPLFDIE